MKPKNIDDMTTSELVATLMLALGKIVFKITVVAMIVSLIWFLTCSQFPSIFISLGISLTFFFVISLISYKKAGSHGT